MKSFKVILLTIVISSVTSSLYFGSELSEVQSKEHNQLLNVKALNEYLDDQISIKSTDNKITVSNLFQQKKLMIK